MGTRNLTMVVYDGKTRVAQYGQWDGYPSGQGATVLKFLHTLEAPGVMKKFLGKLKRCTFINNRKQKQIDAFLTSIGSKDGWLNMEQAQLYHKEYPLLTRDNGAGVLDLIYKHKGRNKIWLHDQSEFAADGLSNEWTYVIDLDKRVLEVYDGFHKEMPSEGSRFYELIVKTEQEEKEAVAAWDKKNQKLINARVSQETILKKIGRRPYVQETNYYIHLLHTFNLDELPTEEEFIKTLTPPEEEE